MKRKRVTLYYRSNLETGLIDQAILWFPCQIRTKGEADFQKSKFLNKIPRKNLPARRFFLFLK